MNRALLIPALASLALAPTVGPGGGASASTRPHSVQHIYATGFGSDHVIRVDVSTGKPPRLIGPSTPTAYGTFGVAASPNARFFYVGLGTKPGIAAFVIRTDGTLSEVAGSPVQTSGPVNTVAVAPDGRHLYVAASEAPSGTVTSYSIASSGLPVQDAAAPVSVGPLSGEFSMLAVTPDGRNLYLTDYFRNQIFHMAIAANGTALTPRQVLTGDGSPVRPAITPNGEYLYASNELQGTVSGYRIMRDGSLTPVAGSPFPAGSTTHGITFSPDGSRAYVMNVGSNNISGYTVGRNGRLTPLPGSPYPAGAGPNHALASADGKRLYVIEESQYVGPTAHLLTFDVLRNGALRQSEQPLDTGLNFTDGPSSAIVR